MLQGIRDIVEDLRAAKGGAKKPVALNRKTVYCLPALAERDELAGMMLTHLLDTEDFAALAVPAQVSREALMAAVVENKVEAVCVSVVRPSTAIHARRLVMALRSQFGEMPILVSLWGVEKKEVLEQRLKQVGANEVSVTMEGALAFFRSVKMAMRP